MNGLDSFMNRFGPKSTPPEHSSVYELDQPSPKAGGLDAFFSRFSKTESYWFYDHTVELQFDTDKHIYYRVGELGNLVPVPGVTTVCGIVDKSHMLVPWASKMVVQKILRLMPTETLDGVICVKPITFEAFTTIALEAKSAHRDKLEDAGDVGHMAHSWLEQWIKAGLSGKLKEQEEMLKVLGVTWQEL